MTPEPGRILSHYRLVEKIGEGGMGVVWKAEDTVLGRMVAIKILPTDLARDEKRRKMFLAEAQSASSISAAQIVHVYDFGTERDLDFIVMEYVEGKTLAKLIQGRPLPPETVCDIGVQIAQALSRAHRHKLIHRDLKPSNVMITAEGEVKVVDFGLAALFSPRESTLGVPTSEASTITCAGEDRSRRVIAGTPPYMSPEQIRGEKLDSRSDIFSLGVVLYEMSTGRHPFPGRSMMERAEAILQCRPVAAHEIVPQMPMELDRILQKTLSARPGDRYQTMDDLAVDLRHLGRELDSGSSPSYEDLRVFTVRDRQRTTRRLTAAAAMASIALIAVLSMVAYLWVARAPVGRPPPDPPRTGDVASLAVLPFRTVGGDPGSEYLGYGIPETIAGMLSRAPRLRVAAGATTAQYEGHDADPRSIGKDLGVAAVLSGSVSQFGEDLVIRAELVDTANGWRLWGEQYRRRGDDILQIERAIAEEIASELKLELAGAQGGKVMRGETDSAEAHRLYLKGRYHLGKYIHDADEALKLFRQAIDTDPAYALAYAGLAQAYWALSSAITDSAEAIPRAKAALRRALEIDPDLPEAHLMSATIASWFDWDWDAADKAYRKAIALNPGDARSHLEYGLYFLIAGRGIDRAVAELQTARQLDPLSPGTSLMALWPLYYGPPRHRDFDRLLTELPGVLEMDPGNYSARGLLAFGQLQKGRHEEALLNLELALTASEGNPFFIAALGHAYGVTGRPGEAGEMLGRLLEMRQKGDYVQPAAMAEIYMGLGETDKVIEWLERAYQLHDENLLLTVLDPRLDPVRGDPRFADLERRLHSGASGPSTR